MTIERQIVQTTGICEFPSHSLPSFMVKNPVSYRLSFIACLLIWISFTGCNSDSTPDTPDGQPSEINQPETSTPSTGPLFRTLSSPSTGIDFENVLIEDGVRNYFQYMYFYNGGGVAAGDFDNDGLTDLFFTGNMVANRIYKNLGNMKFQDMTETAGVGNAEGWHTGVTLADVNTDGLLDFYVCRSGLFEEEERRNLLYVNQGDFTFIESAGEYGLDDPAWSTQATFLDYDLDGDLDCYLVNHPIDFDANILQKQQLAQNPDPNASDKLYRNEDGHFTDITQRARVRNYGFGLSATAGDLNNDGRPDLYVANDFAEPDYLYLNLPLNSTSGGRYFQDFIRESTGHISNFGMGTDIADINNDGLLDIIEMDMMAEDNRRKKTNMSGMDPVSFQYNVDIGYHYQYMQNCLQLNLGSTSGKPIAFSEIGELSGISQTDWSWAPLLADFDNDGFKDLFVTNGVRRDMRDNDFIKWMDEQQKTGLPPNYGEILAHIPVEKIDNYMYRNQGDLTFEKVNGAWSLHFPGFSQGAAYADLDNDGDLDLVTNNLEDQAKIFENRHAQESKNHSLRIKLSGPPANPLALGSRVKVYTGDQVQMQELTLSRGFQSAVEPIVHFGINTAAQADKVEVIWPDGTMITLANIQADKIREVKWEPNGTPKPIPDDPRPLFEEKAVKIGLRTAHKESPYDDFLIESLLPHKYSQLGPCLTVGDLNDDGREDLFVGGASGQSSSIYLQNPLGSFSEKPLSDHKPEFEDLGATIFDANGDGVMDLYVATGGNEWESDDFLLYDQLLLNNGTGKYTPQGAGAMALQSSNAAVAPADFDLDGDLDLFVGTRNIPHKYLVPGACYLLENQGDGTFIKGKPLPITGMVTSAIWSDYDRDADLDLILTGEWMPITVLRNDKGKFTDQTESLGLLSSHGWWYSLASGDIDKDGDLDFVAGNLGLNSKFKASPEGPFSAFAGDFDYNGTHDVLLGYFQNGLQYPVRGRTCASEQIPHLAQKFPSYKGYAAAPLNSIIDVDTAPYAGTAQTFASSFIRNDGDKFTVVPLPNEAQFGPVNGIVLHDVNGDGNLDAVIAGNLLQTEVETARHDGGFGRVLLGDGKGGFTPLSVQESGFYAPGDVKSLALVKGADGHALIVVGNNNGKLQAFRQRAGK